MSWRTVVVSDRAKLECNLGSLVVRNLKGYSKIPITEISVLIVESTAVSLTAALLAELTEKKVKVIFCDEKRNPSSELIPYYGAHDTSYCVKHQIEWNRTTAESVWTNIVGEKINNQRLVLKKYSKKEHLLLYSYLNELEYNDETNREGHAAKVYFNALFGKDFSRDDENNINAALNYGYSIILSAFNREIVSYGYLTQLGICHHNRFNYFNLACDLMEPFRPLVDDIVITMNHDHFGSDEKMILVDVLNQTVNIKKCNHTVLNAIKIYTQSVLDALDTDDITKLRFFRNEL